jgi:hypothetical protein
MAAGDLHPARRVKSIKAIKKPGDYFGPTNEVNDKGEVVGHSVWFLLPTADANDPMQRGGAHFDPELTPGQNRARWLAGRHNGLHRVAEPPWKFRECPDGSLEIRESIACGRGDIPDEQGGGEYFHGYLDEGNIWREV